jgi:small ligand-binding sensory domain FIST
VPTRTGTRIGAGVSAARDTEAAAVEAARHAADALAGREPELAFLFLSAAHADSVEAAAGVIREELAPRRLLGCVAEGVVGRDRELETGPGAAVWAAALPGAEVETFHAQALALDEEAGSFAVAGFPESPDGALVVLLVDPYSFPTGPFLRRLAEERPGLPVVGGIAAGAGRPGSQALIVDDEVHDAGAAGAVVSGVPFRTVVSQGCAPFGREAVITRAEGNVVYELAGERALDRLRAEVVALSDAERELVTRGLLAGIVIDENRSEYRRGDYLVRGLIGVDEEAGALAFGELVRVGQTVRFHVRDAQSADEDLRESLETALAGERVAGALAFTCNGRGTSMFPAPDHDARAVAEAIGSPAIAGFFCGGEIGPVGGRPFLHGFTATLALFLE